MPKQAEDDFTWKTLRVILLLLTAAYLLLQLAAAMP